jgi:hypothetical protein
MLLARVVGGKPVRLQGIAAGCVTVEMVSSGREFALAAMAAASRNGQPVLFPGNVWDGSTYPTGVCAATMAVLQVGNACGGRQPAGVGDPGPTAQAHAVRVVQCNTDLRSLSSN